MTVPTQVDSNTHTFFFREPEALAVVRDRARSRKRISVWSAGCSSGDEVYSLAIRLHDFPHEITGSDIRRDALDVARSGLYPQRRLRHTDVDTVRSFFTPVGEMVRADPQLRRSMRLVEHHIINDTPLVPVHGGLWDVILCRNVLLYYDEQDMAAAIQRLASVLAPDGILILGASEWLSTALLARLPKELQLVASLEHGVVVHKHGIKETSGTRRHSAQRTVAPIRVPPKPEAAADVSALRAQGDALMDTGDAKSAIALFRTALQREPLAADLYARLGFCHLALGQSSAAEEDLRRALFLAPKLWPAALVLGDLLMSADARAARRFLLQAWDAVERGGLDPAAAATALLAPFVCAESAALDAVRVRLAWLKGREKR